jgi:DNA repair protein RecO (recombination protein O)
VRKAIASDALLVRSVAYGESDLIVTLLTESDGKVSALVRGGRKSARRVGGALEPVHTLAVKLDDRGGDLATLREATISTVRARTVMDLEALDAAGIALRWARHLFPPRHVEPHAWATTVALLDDLEAGFGPPRALLAGAALRLLADFGYALDLDRCVKCSRPCPEARAAAIDAARGGLVCQSCGGARRLIAPELRRIGRASQKAPDGRVAMTADQAEQLLDIVHDAMAAHAGFDRE